MGQSATLLGQVERKLKFPADRNKIQTVPQHWEELGRLSDLQTELLRASIGTFSLPGLHSPWLRSQLSRGLSVSHKFLAGTLGGVRQSLEQFQSSSEMIDGFCVR